MVVRFKIRDRPSLRKIDRVYQSRTPLVARMSIEVNNPRLREVVPQPWQTEIYAVKLEHCNIGCRIDQCLDIGSKLRFPKCCIHKQIAINPVLLIQLAEMLKSVVFTPIIINTDVSVIKPAPSHLWIKPAPFVKRLIIGRTSRDVPKDIPYERRAAPKPRCNEHRSFTRLI